MFGIKAKKQKVDQKTLLVAVDSALDGADAVSADQLLAETGKTRQELLDAVMADDEVVSCRADIQGAINAEAWRIWGEDVNEELINHLYRMVRRLMSDFIGLAILAKFNGYAVGEYVFVKEPTGFLTLQSVLSKDGELDNYTPMRNGSVLLKTEEDSIEINQAIKYLVLKSEAVPARPAGEMMIVRAYPAVALRKREWAYAGQFIARYSQPYVVGTQGESSGFSKTINDFTSTIFSFINGGAAGIGKDDKIELHQLSGDGQAFELFERLANRRIQKLLLGRVKTSELTSGSRASQETDDEARQDRVSSYMSLMVQGIQHAIDATIEVNKYWGQPITAPQGIWFEYQKQTKPDQNRATVDKMYADTGQIVFTQEYYRDILGYEEKHFRIVEPSANRGSQPSNAQLSQQPYLLSQNLPSSLTADDESDNDAKTVHEQQFMQPKINALLDAMADSKDYADFERKLSQVVLPDAGLVTDIAKQCTHSYVEGLAADNAQKD